MMSNLGKIAIIGLGLIGGSLAKALKKAQMAEIIAVDFSKSTLAEALAQNVADEAYDWNGDLSPLCEADIVVLAVPVGAMGSVCQRLKSLNLKEKVVISDVGSTKTSVLSAFQETWGEIPPFFVPAHPIAGREKSGFAYAEADLFQNHRVILSTLPNTDNYALGTISRMWHATGAMISYLPVEIHDEILGATSHLPHLLAYLLVDMLNQNLHHEDIFSYSAGGFRDFTRIASSSPVMWRDIAVNNHAVLSDLLDIYKQRITELQTLLHNQDEEAIEALFQRAKNARDNHYQKEHT